MSRDQLITFKSKLGNTIVCPSQWKSQDDGAQWSLTSPDGHALIHIWTCTVEGSGSHEDFEQTVLMNLMDDDKRTKCSATTVLINESSARRVALKASDTKSGSSYLVFTLRAGQLYHALLVKAAPPVMDLNGGFYEELVSSFKGVSAPP